MPRVPKERGKGAASAAAAIAPEELHVQGLLDQFRRIDETMPDRAFCFVLGAGASRSSRIKTGGELVRDWIAELYRMDPRHDSIPIERWTTASNLGIDGFDAGDPAASYPQIYQRRFRDDPAEGYAYLERAMQDAEPSYGYSVLARMLAETRHKVVVTTNFDNLVADALSIFTTTFPLVCGHESLAGFVRARPRRPLVVKVHRDLLLAPKSRPSEIAKLPKDYARALAQLLRWYTPVVLGYGGNDGSLMGFLGGLEPLEGGIYWCYRDGDTPTEAIRSLVARHRGRMVRIPGFDELMAMFADQLGYELRDKWIVERAAERANRLVETVTKLRDTLRERREKVESAPPAEAGAAPRDEMRQAIAQSSQAVESIFQRQTGKRRWWQWRDLANASSSPAEAEAYYREGLKELADDPWMIDATARFLGRFPERVGESEEFHRRAVALAPDSGGILGNFANFLARIPGREAEAEDLYRRALQRDPGSATKHGNFAGFLLALGRTTEGLAELAIAQQALRGQPPRPLHAECEFYAYAHGPETARAAALTSLKKLLVEQGVRSPVWDLARNVERAERDGHPAAVWLARLAGAIQATEPLAVLDAWEEWRKA
jgi:tetratricopeptide (TPR) repeat protein